MRWDSMPVILREAMTSEVNSDVVWKTAESEHLPKEKIATVSRLTGYALMGFIHLEELTNEISESTGIDKRIAAAIAGPINIKIFQPLREELEKIYAPALSKEEMLTLDEAETPAKRASEPLGKEGPPKPQPVAIEDITKPQSSIPVMPPAPFPVARAPKPQGTIPVPTLQQKPPLMMPSQFTKTSPEPAVTTSSPIKKMDVSPAITQTKTEPAAASEAKPFMLHQETELHPISPAKSNFKIGLSEEQFGKMEQKVAPKPKPAQIETDAEEDKKPAVKVVHYNDMKTPLVPSRIDGLPPSPPKPASTLVAAFSGTRNAFDTLKEKKNATTTGARGDQMPMPTPGIQISETDKKNTSTTSGQKTSGMMTLEIPSPPKPAGTPSTAFSSADNPYEILRRKPSPADGPEIPSGIFPKNKSQI